MERRTLKMPIGRPQGDSEFPFGAFCPLIEASIQKFNLARRRGVMQ
jgi:hypothetical protein